MKEEHEHPYLPGIHSLELFYEVKGPIQNIPLKRDECFASKPHIGTVGIPTGGQLKPPWIPSTNISVVWRKECRFLLGEKKTRIIKNLNCKDLWRSCSITFCSKNLT